MDKLNGPNCRQYNINTGELYSGPITDGKRDGKGRLYDADKDEVYDGNFENNKRCGQGMIYRRSGEVLKGDFRNNMMEGPFKNV